MKTALIVDDSHQNLYFLELLLKSSDFKPVQAHNGVEALAAARACPPDLIISDILMPEMDGWTLCREWRADPRLQNIPFIFYTATYTEAKDEEFALKLGADRFVTKPQEPEILIRILQEVLDKPAKEIRHEPPSNGEFFPGYSEVLFRKLQKKLASLEQANAELTVANNKLSSANDELLLLSTAVAATPAAIVITDAQGKIEWVNEAFVRTSGYLFSEAIGQNPRLLKSGRHAPEFYADLWRTIAGGKPWHGEIINRRKNGTLYTEDATIAPVNNAAGVISHYVSVRVDVTEKKRLNEQLFRVQRLESIGMLATGIAHDLNNMLSPVLMAAPLVRRYVADPKARDLIDTMERSAVRGGGLVRQILCFARGVVGEPQIVEIKHLLSEVASMISRTFPQEISIDYTYAADLWPIQACPTQIHQVLLNLCVNARDALMPKGGKLRIDAANRQISEEEASKIEGLQPGSWIRISVEDNGEGMSPEVLGKIWDPFFTTKPADKGTGLGLYTARGIIKSHNGFITVESEAGKGTVFKIYLPAAEQAAEKAPTKETLRPKGHGELIVVVDETAESRKATADYLARRGYRVLTSADGGNAMSLILGNANELALLITDVETPRLCGAALIRTAQQLNPGAKVLIVSGHERPVEIEPGQAPHKKLRKPFTEEALLDCVCELIPAKT